MPGNQVTAPKVVRLGAVDGQAPVEAVDQDDRETAQVQPHDLRVHKLPDGGPDNDAVDSGLAKGTHRLLLFPVRPRAAEYQVIPRLDQHRLDAHHHARRIGAAQVRHDDPDGLHRSPFGRTRPLAHKRTLTTNAVDPPFPCELAQSLLCRNAADAGHASELVLRWNSIARLKVSAPDAL